MKNGIFAIALAAVLLTISARFVLARPRGQQEGKPAVSLSRPRTDGQLECTPDAGGIYRCSVAGTYSGLSQDHRLLLWVRPVRPPSESEGWYLQRRPNGITNQARGSWDGKMQIGNRDFPPHDGDIVDVTVSVTESGAANKLMRASGVVIEPEPVGITTATSQNVRLRIPRPR